MKILLTGWIFCLTMALQSQAVHDSTPIELEPVHIFGTSQKDDNGVHLPENPVSSLSDIRKYSPVYIKSYGPGSLSTISLRGASASQTAVLWNGIDLRSPMNGTVDFSLIPLFFFDQVKILPSSIHTVSSSDAIGGSVELNNQIKTQPKGWKAELHQNAGSALNLGTYLSAEYQATGWRSAIKMLHQNHLNKFRYRDPSRPGEQVARQEHAAFRLNGIFKEDQVSIRNSLLILHFWYQDAQRQIPPTIFQPSAAFQEDQNLRASAQWHNYYSLENGAQVKYTLHSAWLHEKVVFIDPTVNLHAGNVSQTIYNRATAEIDTRKDNRLTIGFHHNRHAATADGYDTISPVENRYALFAQFDLRNKNDKFRGMINIRQEYAGGWMIPAPSAAFTVSLIRERLFLEGNLAYNYRLPGFNDRYWQPGGNPDLMPESGWGQELSVRGNLFTKWNSRVTAFNRNINNWIIWTPKGHIWTPENLLSVWSRGMEVNSDFQYQTKKMSFHTGISGSYTLSTNQNQTSPNDASAGKQLIYVPYLNANAFLSVGYENWWLSFHQSYTGKRFITSDNSRWLDPYLLGTLHLGRRVEWKNHAFTFYGTIDNLWNVNYQSMVSRPMPLRNYQLGIQFQYH